KETSQTQETPLTLAALQHSYDLRIVDTTRKQQIDLTQVAKQLKNADVIFIGEYHGNNAAHWLQAQLQYLLYQQRPQQILSMEQFTRNEQPQVDQYLTGKIGEQELIDNTEAWSNYKASYRPLVEFAKLHHLPVIAANAPADIVRCVGQQGQDYIKTLNDEQKQYIAKQPFYYESAYLEKFSGVMHIGREDTQNNHAENKALTPSNSFYAQILRDNSMAQAIADAYQRYPNHQIIHINGAFHSDSFLGTVSSLKHRLPNLKIAVLSPIQHPLLQDISVDKPLLTQGQYVYYIADVPVDYLNTKNRMTAMQKMMERAKEKAQSCVSTLSSSPMTQPS
ncbi:hypothetical protein GWI33_010019, partial [Rhynchophorus ferrugineus]